MALPVIRFDQFDPSQVNIDLIRTKELGKGMKMRFVSLSYGPRRDRIILQTPPMRVPFSIYGKDGTLSFSVAVDAADPDCTTFMERMQLLDERICAHAEGMSREWFGAAKTLDVLRATYNASIKPPSDPKYSPIFRARPKVMRSDGVETTQTRAWHRDGSPATMDDIGVGSTIALLVELPCIYISGAAGFGVSAKASQVMVTKPAWNANTCAFVGMCMDAEDADDDTCDENSNAMAFM